MAWAALLIKLLFKTEFLVTTPMCGLGIASAGSGSCIAGLRNSRRDKQVRGKADGLRDSNPEELSGRDTAGALGNLQLYLFACQGNKD